MAYYIVYLAIIHLEYYPKNNSLTLTSYYLMVNLAIFIANSVFVLFCMGES